MAGVGFDGAGADALTGGHAVSSSSQPGRRILISLEKMAGIESYVPDRVHTYSTRSGTQI